MNLYNFTVTNAAGKDVALEKYRGKLVLIVNTASKCGFAPQFGGLQALYEEFQGQGLEILGFPCNQFLFQEPGKTEDIVKLCQLNYGVDFEMFDKIAVKGKNAIPLYAWLTDKNAHAFGGAIKWNFTKFLIGRDGELLNRYEPTVTPESIKPTIQELLSK